MISNHDLVLHEHATAFLDTQKRHTTLGRRSRRDIVRGARPTLEDNQMLTAAPVTTPQNIGNLRGLHHGSPRQSIMTTRSRPKVRLRLEANDMSRGEDVFSRIREGARLCGVARSGHWCLSRLISAEGKTYASRTSTVAMSG